MRRKLIATLRQKGISDERVLMAMEALPRHFFLERAFEEKAYEDIAFPIGKEQTISQPYTVAYQSQHLEIATNNRVLEIGTGSGYQAAILSLMGAHVYTIERQKMLHEKSRDLLKKIGVDKSQTEYNTQILENFKFVPFLKGVNE